MEGLDLIRGGESATITRLKRLKRNGCVVLGAGDEPRAARAALCRRMMGTTERRRTRVLGLPSSYAEVETNYLPGGVGPDDPAVRTVSFEDNARSTASTTTTTTTTATPDTGRPGSRALRFAGDCQAAIEDLTGEDWSRDLASAELRVGIDALSSLIEAEGSSPTHVFRALSPVMTATKQCRGICLLLVDRPYDSDLVRQIWTNVADIDARVDLRARPELPTSDPEQRWTVRGCETTEWVAVNPDHDDDR